MIKINMMMIITALIMMFSCAKDNQEMINVGSTTTSTTNVDSTKVVQTSDLPIRPGARPATSAGIPHVQLDLDLVPDVHDEMIRRIFSIPGIVNEPSVILSWEGLWVDSNVEVANPQAFISGREFGHVHDDGSLHIFLEPTRAIEAIEAGWAVSHPYAVQGRDGWDGFVMLYTPTTIEELNVVFELIVDAFNYVTGQQVEATDFY